MKEVAPSGGSGGGGVLLKERSCSLRGWVGTLKRKKLLT